MTKFKIDNELIEKMARTSKFNEITIEKVQYTKIVLKKIVESKIGNDFALMGGSSLAFFHEKPYRLSTDLDLDYIGNHNLGREGTSEIDAIKDRHSKILSEISNSLGFIYSILKSNDNRMLRLQLGYKSHYGKNASVELDIGYRYCHSVLPLEGKKWIHFTPLDKSDELVVQNLNRLEVWANQIVSTIGGERIDFEGKHYLGSRRKLRHLYDTYYFVENVFPSFKRNDIKLLKNLSILFGVTRIKNFELFRGDVLSLYNKSKINEELFSVLKTDKSPPELIEMQRGVRKFLDRVIFNEWSDDLEYRFVTDFSNGEFRPMDLFKDQDIADKLGSMYYYDEILGKVI